MLPSLKRPACFNVCHVCFISDTKVIYLFNIRVVFSLKVLFLFPIVYTLRFKLFLGITKLCSLQSLRKGIQVAFMEGSRLNPEGGKSEIVKKPHTPYWNFVLEHHEIKKIHVFSNEGSFPFLREKNGKHTLTNIKKNQWVNFNQATHIL